MNLTHREPHARLPAIALACVALVGLACGANRRPMGSAEAVTHGGMERSFVLYKPEDLARGAPLVVSLHGGGGTGHRMQNYTGFNELADARGFGVLYPDGVGNGWNDGRDAINEASEQDLDDVAFLTSLIEQTIEEHGFDPERVYIMGISNGGFMTAALLCSGSTLFAAAAPVIAGISSNTFTGCAPARPTPMIIFKGTDDPLVPYHGGPIARTRGEVEPTSTELEFWREVNGCAPSISETRWADHDPNDGIKTRIEIWRDGCELAPVHMYTVEGGGHTLPGNMSQYAPRRFIGAPNQDVIARDEMWEFFAQVSSARSEPR